MSSLTVTLIGGPTALIEIDGFRLINEALEAGILKNHIGARFALDDTAQAHVAVESGSVIGNVVVTVN